MGDMTRRNLFAGLLGVAIVPAVAKVTIEPVAVAPLMPNREMTEEERIHQYVELTHKECVKKCNEGLDAYLNKYFA